MQASSHSPGESGNAGKPSDPRTNSQRPGIRRAFSPARPAALAAVGLLASAFIALLSGLAPLSPPDPVPEAIILPENPQSLGDPARGYEYLIYGDYIGAGIPAQLFNAFQPPIPEDKRLLDRKGPSAGIPHEFNRFTMPNGADVVAGVSCLGCHAQTFQGELVVGLGNSLSDFTNRFEAAPVRQAASMLYAAGSPEREALEQILRGGEALESAVTPFMGVNPAFRYEELAAAHRNPHDLSWTDDRVFEPNEVTYPSDVPAWWHIQKKHALYYLGLGRGDFVRAIQQITVVAIKDKEDAARIADRMRDLLAYLFTLEAPQYDAYFPDSIDLDLARDGAKVFASNCAECHGEYDRSMLGGPARETYPNKLISIHEVGTDPYYAENLRSSGLWEWFNESWYA
ncbi:MAG: hypothetical protein AAF235_11350, partial [Planctomycetota bacterium]